MTRQQTIEKWTGDDGWFAPFAWPGGYPVFYIDSQNDVLCAKCANKVLREDALDALRGMKEWKRNSGNGYWGEQTEAADNWDRLYGWHDNPKIAAAAPNYEDIDLYCDECSSRIESAYREDDYHNEIWAGIVEDDNQVVVREWKVGRYDVRYQLAMRVCAGWMSDNTKVEYWFRQHNAPVLFHGKDFKMSPLHSLDADQTIGTLLSFLTLKPGDTDAEYLADYTAEQLEWCQGEDAEQLSIIAYDLENPRSEDADEPDESGNSVPKGWDYAG